MSVGKSTIMGYVHLECLINTRTAIVLILPVLITDVAVLGILHHCNCQIKRRRTKKKLRAKPSSENTRTAMTMVMNHRILVRF